MNDRKLFGQSEPFYKIQSREVVIGFNTEAKVEERFTDKFIGNDTQRKIMKMMLTNPKVSRDAITDENGITTRSVQKSMNTLKALGNEERIGTAKDGH